MSDQEPLGRISEYGRRVIEDAAEENPVPLLLTGEEYGRMVLAGMGFLDPLDRYDDQHGEPEEELAPVAKLDSADGSKSWLLAAVDPYNGDSAYGLSGDAIETASLSQLAAEGARRDTSFTPTPGKALADYQREAAYQERARQVVDRFTSPGTPKEGKERDTLEP